jgi:hypothetical protein
MRCSSLRPFSPVLGLGLGLAFACSSATHEPEPDRAIESEVVAATPATPTPATEEPHAPTVGAPAPALDLVSLAGTRVQLPVLPDMGSERATVLIFGSFS